MRRGEGWWVRRRVGRGGEGWMLYCGLSSLGKRIRPPSPFVRKKSGQRKLCDEELTSLQTYGHWKFICRVYSQSVRDNVYR